MAGATPRLPRRSAPVCGAAVGTPCPVQRRTCSAVARGWTAARRRWSH